MIGFGSFKDLYMLFEAIRYLGSFDDIVRNMQFNTLCEYLQIPGGVASCSTQLRNRYQKLVYPCKRQLASAVDEAYVACGMNCDNIDFLKSRGVAVDKSTSGPHATVRSNAPHLNHHGEKSEEGLPEATTAAIRARMNSNSLEDQEYNHDFFKSFRPSLTQLDLRNHILRMWYRNVCSRLDIKDALRDVPTKFHRFGIAVFTFLELTGSINFGAVPVDTIHAKHCLRCPTETVNVAIVGAGVAGISAARHLKAHGVNVTVLEARNRPGGRAFTDTNNFSAPVDLGAMVITGVNQNPIGVLAQQVNADLFYTGNDCPLFDIDGNWVSPDIDRMAEQEYNSILDITARYRSRKDTKGNIESTSLGEAFQRALELRAKKRAAQRFKDDIFLTGLRAVKHYRNNISLRRDARLHDTFEDSRVQQSAHSTTTPSKMNKTSVASFRAHDPTSKNPDEDIGQETRRHQEQLGRLLRWHVANLEYGCAADISQVSLKHWDQDDPYGFLGEHALLPSGFDPLLRALLDGIDNDITYGAKVTEIRRVQYAAPEQDLVGNTVDEQMVVIQFTTDGVVKEVTFDAAIVTVPLGNLKENLPVFKPRLPLDKTNAIQRLGNGGLVKIVMEFQQAFWIDKNMFGALRETADSRGEHFLFWNLHRCTDKPILVSLVAEPSVRKAEGMTDQQIVQNTMQILRRCYKKAPSPCKARVTRWSSDPLSRGAYSYIPVGSSGDDYDFLAAPVGGTLFFAGEHTCRRYPTTTASALISGYREASNVLHIFNVHNRIMDRNCSYANGEFRAVRGTRRRKVANAATNREQWKPRDNQRVSRIQQNRSGPRK